MELCENDESREECFTDRVEHLNYLLVRLICSAPLPFDTVESDAFRLRLVFS